MKKIIVLCVFAVFSVSSFAQQKPFSNLREALLSGSKLAGKSGPQSINWLPDGETFSYIDKPGSIVRFNPSNQQTSAIFSSDGLTFPNTSTPFQYQSFQWSADGKYLLFQTNFKPVWRYSGDADYYLYSLADKKLTLLASGARTAQLSPDGQKIVYERGGDLYLRELATLKEVQLTNDAGKAVYNGRFGWAYEEEFGLVQAWVWSPDSRYIAFWHSDESQVPMYQLSDFQAAHPTFDQIPYPRVGDPNIQVKIGILDLQEQNKVQWTKFDLQDGYVPRIYWTSQTGQLAIQHLNRAQNHLTVYFAKAQDGSTQKIFEEKDEKGWIDVFDFFANSNDFMLFPPQKQEFYWISGRSGHQHIYVYDYKGQIIRQLTSGNWDVMSLQAYHAKNDALLFTSTENTPLERHLYSIQTSGKNKLHLTPEKGLHQVNVSPSGRYFVDTYSSITTPKVVQLKNDKGANIHTFETNANVGEFVKTIPYAQRELHQFTTSDGQKIDIYVVKPVGFDATKKYPLVLTIYGGPGSQSVYNQWSSSAWEQWLAQNGYVVASVNNRGSGGYGQAFMQAVYEQLGKVESQDFVEAANYLSRTYSWINPEKRAIQGHSYGGFMSSYTMVNHPDAFRVGLVGAPVTDWRLYDNIYTERYMGLLPQNTDKYASQVVTKNAKNLKGKILLAHSTMDDNVHIINTFQAVKAFTDAGKDIDLRIYPPGNHAVSYSTESYVLLYQTYFNYLETHLK
ncbi:MAG: S9 family peptidase [Spirosomataceae bacterium]